MARPPRQIALLALVLAALVPAVAHAAPGAVTLVRAAGNAGSPAEQGFLISRVWRMHGATAWQSNTWARRSAYALDTATAAAHPEWVLMDRYSRPLYIDGLPAADFANTDFQAWWIAQATAQAAGLRGLYIDDVTMTRRTYLSWGSSATPRDPRTNATMTEANWQRYMADFMVAVRAAFPAAEIVHDVLWHKGDAGADIARELSAASHIAIEKGFNDPLITGGAGPYGFRTLTAFVERRQAAGQGVILDAPTDTAAGITFGLANLLLLDTARARARQRPLDRSGPLLAGLQRQPGRAVRAAHVLVGRVEARLRPRGRAGQRARHGLPHALAGRRLRGARRHRGQGRHAGRRHRAAVAQGAGRGDPDPDADARAGPDTAVPVATATPAPPRRPRRRTSNPTASIAGAAEPGRTSVTVTVSRLAVSGRVKGAVSGYVHVTVQRKRGKGWVTARRVKPNISKRGRFEGAIARLSRGTYRVGARFEGTGTARPSRSPYRTRRL